MGAKKKPATTKGPPGQANGSASDIAQAGHILLSAALRRSQKGADHDRMYLAIQATGQVAMAKCLCETLPAILDQLEALVCAVASLSEPSGYKEHD